MSKIRLHGSSSGYMEIAPPAAGSSETITLPNSAGEVLLSDGSAASLTQIPAANIVGVCTSGLTKGGGGFGKILQVVNVDVANTSITTSSSSFVSMNTSVVITPSAASSKIFILMTGGGTYLPNQQTFAYVTVYRGDTNLSDGNYGLEGFYSTGNVQTIGPHSLSVLDTPTYTLGDAITYTIYARSTGGVYQFQNTDRSHITLTAMEVAT